MANMSPYYLTGFGQWEEVIGLARLLMPLLEDETSVYGFPLSLVKEFPELGEGDHPWIGVTRFRVDEEDEHRFGGDGKGKSESEIAREHAAMVGFTLEENPAILAMKGYARWSLPFDCAIAISQRFPTMLLELRGRCDIRERWYEVFWMNGDGHYFEVVDLDPRTPEKETYYIREGVTIVPLPDDNWGHEEVKAVGEPEDECDDLGD